MDEVKLLPCVTICGVEQPKRIWLMCYRHAGDICWTSDPNPEDADEIETVEYIRADTRPTIVTDELVELREASAFLCQRMREFGGSDLGRLTGAVEQVERIIAAMPAIPPQSLGDQIKHMVDRFLMWKLPADFNPDGGVSFKPSFSNEPMRSRHWPVGTNLLDAMQAEAMVRHMLEGLPEASETPTPGPAIDQDGER